jgi:hypothetical protein
MLAKQDGMQFHQPTLPPGTRSLQVFGIRYRGYTLDFTTDGVSMAWNATSEGMCLFRPPAGTGERELVGAHPVPMDINEFFGQASSGRYGKIGLCSAS